MKSFDKTDNVSEDIPSFQESVKRAKSKTQAIDDNVISMDHSDDIDQSAPEEQMEMLDEVIQDSQNDDDEAIIDDVGNFDDMSGEVG